LLRTSIPRWPTASRPRNNGGNCTGARFKRRVMRSFSSWSLGTTSSPTTSSIAMTPALWVTGTLLTRGRSRRVLRGCDLVQFNAN
jgi:hypothetical protein